MFKLSKNIDEDEVFGFKENIQGKCSLISLSLEPRHDYGRVSSEKAEVIVISKPVYEGIVKKTNLTEGERKLDFLQRYVPKIRAAGRNMIEEFEIFFFKEECTRGHIL